MDTWRNGDMETWTGDIDRETWTGDIDRQTWKWRRGHGDMEMDTWGHGITVKY
jgi:hypothetical protein